MIKPRIKVTNNAQDHAQFVAIKKWVNNHHGKSISSNALYDALEEKFAEYYNKRYRKDGSDLSKCLVKCTFDSNSSNEW